MARFNWRLRTPVGQPGQDTDVTFDSRLDPFCARAATVFGGALTRHDGSDLLTLRLPFAHKPAVLFSASPAFWKFDEACLPSNSSRRGSSFCNAFQRLSFARFSEPPESSAPCWRTVATIYPLGNCDSPRLETCPGYLTQLGAVSHRSSSLSSFFALLEARERRQRNW